MSGVQEVYDALIGAYDDYQKNKKADAADKLVKINADRLTSDVAKSCYDKIKKATYATATKKYFEEGRDAYNGTGSYSKRDYDKSIKLLEKSLSFDENNTDAIYFLGRCYQQKSDVEKAKSYYNKIVDNYPDSKRVSEAKRRLPGTWRINYQLDKMIGFPVRVYEGKNTLAGIFAFKNKGRKAINNGTSTL